MPITTYNIENKARYSDISSHISVDTQSQLERRERLAMYSGLNHINQDAIQEIKQPDNAAPITYKKVRETERERRHTQVFAGTDKIGYYIKNDSKYALVGENWNFVSYKTSIPNIKAETEKEIRLNIEETLYKRIR